MLSFISIYLGSNILSGTDVFGKIIKLFNGKIGIILGKLFLALNILQNNLLLPSSNAYLNLMNKNIDKIDNLLKIAQLKKIRLI